MIESDSEINRAVARFSDGAADARHRSLQERERHGYPIGDQVLQWVGRTLRDSCRVYDIPGRYGGEEFCVVLPQTRLGNTTIVAERMRTRLAESPLRFGENSLNVTASFGIAGVDCLPSYGVINPATLIDRAYLVLYAAKHRGRNRIELWQSGEDSVVH